MSRKLTLVLTVLLALGLLSGAASAAGKILAVGLVNPQLMTTYLQNAGFAPAEYTVVSTKAELEKEWANRSAYSALIFAYHGLANSADAQAFFQAHQAEYVDFVKNGGGVLSTVRDEADQMLITPFNIAFVGAGSYATTNFDIAVNHPVFAGVDMAALNQQISGAADNSFVDSGLVSNTADIPAIAFMPGTKEAAIVAGTAGKGRVMFGGAEFFWQDYPTLPEHQKLIKNLVNWVRGGSAQTAMFIHQTGLGGSSDDLAVKELEKLGFAVTVVEHTAVATENPDNYNLIVISSTTASGNVAGVPSIFATKTPVINYEAFLQDDFKVASSPSNEMTDTITILANHPITNGLSGQVQVSKSAINMHGSDAAGSQVLAKSASLSVLIAVEKGDKLIDGSVSPNRRVMLPGDDSVFELGTSSWYTLFDQAVAWATAQ